MELILLFGLIYWGLKKILPDEPEKPTEGKNHYEALDCWENGVKDATSVPRAIKGRIMRGKK